MDKTVEEKAVGMGWQPKEEFKGDPDKWVSAEEFVSRGENLMPILKATNRRQNEKLDEQGRQITELTQKLTEAQEAIAGLREYNSKETRERMKQSLETTKAQIKEARAAGDVDREIELTTELQAGKTELEKAEAAPPPERKPENQDFTKDPQWIAWSEENPWYGKDRRKTGLAMGVAAELKQANPSLKGKALLDRVAEEVGKVYPDVLPPNKVESGGNRGSGGGRGGQERGKSFSDLPDEAKAACQSFVGRLVGPNKAYKTVEDWQRQYTADFFSGEQA